MSDIARIREYEKHKHDTIMKIVDDALAELKVKLDAIFASPDSPETGAGSCASAPARSMRLRDEPSTGELRSPVAVASKLLSAERAAELTSLCSEVSSNGKGFNAILWCSAIGESVVGKGATVLAAVLDAHAKSNALKGRPDAGPPLRSPSVAQQAALTAFAVAEHASTLTLTQEQLATIIDSAIELNRLVDEQFVGEAYAAGYGDGLGNYRSREAEFRAAVSQSAGQSRNARRLEHYWRYCNALSHPSYFGLQEWLKQLDEDIAERTPEEAPRADGAGR